ncbi:uncharacterized protein LOC130113424 [Lampris incognitus]|uniref:uncharacterized protein LOC130113424 n=1 Tax=Lampris incognitus TaxID=2546036 RepID=UPI0024B4A4A7|nr:uncharacterized protein LOC130113424 [Lampris incognitus]
MAAVACVVVGIVLSLLSVGQSVPLPTCERLIQPLENPSRDMVLGKWRSVAESYGIAVDRELLQSLAESARIDVTPGSQSNTLTVVQVQKMFGVCTTLTSGMTFDNNSYHAVHPIPTTDVLLNTSCSDCLLFHQKSAAGTAQFTTLQLLSRSGRVTASELEEFEEQVKCLKLPPPIVMDPEKEPCPDPESSSSNTHFLDLTNKWHRIFSVLVTANLLQVLNETWTEIREKVCGTWADCVGPSSVDIAFL